jgi:hypothetical protein
METSKNTYDGVKIYFCQISLYQTRNQWDNEEIQDIQITRNKKKRLNMKIIIHKNINNSTHLSVQPVALHPANL